MALHISKWNYHERCSATEGVISEWIKDSHMSKKTQAVLERTLDQLRQLPKTSWSKPQPASSLGNHIYVIRFRDITGSQLRIFGHFYDEHSAFVMTFDGYEKDNVYYPKNYKDVAKRHQASCDKAFRGATREFRNNCPLCQSERDEAGQ